MKTKLIYSNEDNHELFFFSNTAIIISQHIKKKTCWHNVPPTIINDQAVQTLRVSVSASFSPIMGMDSELKT